MRIHNNFGRDDSLLFTVLFAENRQRLMQNSRKMGETSALMCDSVPVSNITHSRFENRGQETCMATGHGWSSNRCSPWCPSLSFNGGACLNCFKKRSLYRGSAGNAQVNISPTGAPHTLSSRATPILVPARGCPAMWLAMMSSG